VVGCRNCVGTATVTNTLLSSRGFRVNTQVVGELPNRPNTPDTRGHGASLQVTKHSEQQKVILGTHATSDPSPLDSKSRDSVPLGS
jgi:hypothetical protein